MRKPVKYRIAFLIVAAVCFYIGTWFLPSTLPDITLTFSNIISEPSWRNTALVSLVYFLVLPVMYYFWVIRIGEQALWKVLLIFSLSSLIARYNYPEQLAHYFAFISYLKYPIIAVLMVIEVVLLVTIVKALWDARKLSGDPRIHMLEKYEKEEAPEKSSKEAKQLELALMLAHEPASWYYAIPSFSKKHVKNAVHLKLLSGKWWHLLGVLIALSVTTYASYVLLSQFSETIALVVATLVFYLVIMFVANYRVSKNYSCYVWQDKVVVNNSWWGIVVIPKANIESMEIGEWSRSLTKEDFHFGRGVANVKLTFNRPQAYYSGMALLNESISMLYLSVDNPSLLYRELEAFTVQREI